MEIITSKDNSKIKYIRSLQQKKYREREKKYLVEGLRFAEEALGYPADIDTVVYTPALMEGRRGRDLVAKAAALGLTLVAVSDTVFKELSGTETPQGIMAVMKMDEKPFAPDAIADEGGLLLVVDGVQDPGNLGTIVRTADAAGVKNIILLKGTVDIYNPKTLRSTMGSVFRVNCHIWNDSLELAALFRDKGIRLYVASAGGGKTIYEADYNGPVALVLGSEAAGPGAVLTEQADSVITIPMLGNAESLNVAVAAGIIIFEAVRQRIHPKMPL